MKGHCDPLEEFAKKIRGDPLFISLGTDYADYTVFSFNILEFLRVIRVIRA